MIGLKPKSAQSELPPEDDSSSAPVASEPGFSQPPTTVSDPRPYTEEDAFSSGGQRVRPEPQPSSTDVTPGAEARSYSPEELAQVSAPVEDKPRSGIARLLGLRTKHTLPESDEPSKDKSLKSLLARLSAGRQKKKEASPTDVVRPTPDTPKKSGGLLSVLGLSSKTKAPEQRPTGRIIRLDEPAPVEALPDSSAAQRADEAESGTTAHPPEKKRSLRERLSRGSPPETVPVLGKKSHIPQTFFGLPNEVAPAVLLPLLVAGVLFIVLPRLAVAPLPGGGVGKFAVVALAVVLGSVLALARANREREDSEKLTLIGVARGLREKQSVPEGTPIAFLGGSEDADKSFGWRKLFTSVFPTRDVVGLDIGAGTLRAALVRDGLVVSVAQHSLPPGIIVKGLLVDPAALTAEIRAFWAQAGMGSTNVNIAISNRQVALRTLSLAAATDERDLELAIAVNAETVLRPMSTDNAIIDYTELTRGGARVVLQLAAAEKKMVRSFMNAVQSAGLTCISCELGPLAEGRALIVPRHQGVAHGVINIGAETTTFICASGADIFFLRIVEIGGNDFTFALQQRIGCTWEQAEQLKLRSGLGVEPVDPVLADDPDLFAACQEALQYVADRLTQELAGTPHLFQEGQEGRPVTGLTLLGDGARLVGLVEQISMFMRVPDLTPVTPRPGVELGEEFPPFATAIGLALGHRMSLLPDVKRSFSLALPGRRRHAKISSERTKKQSRRLKNSRGKKAGPLSPAVIGLLLVLVIAGGAYVYSTRLKTENDSLREEAQSTQGVVDTTSAPRYTGPNAEGSRLEIVSSQLIASPNFAVLPSIIESTAELTEVTVSSSAGIITVDATTDNEDAASAAFQSIAVLEGVESAIPDDNIQAPNYSITIRAPNPKSE